MDKMHKEGGLDTDGVDVDPVSGNEIPIGAEAEEVRDDVDAKLSKNEFVIPADVVRYFGVAHFEKMIGRAKKGWAEMEEDGRIGGADGPDEDDLPFTDEELMALEMEEEAPVEMAIGGLVDPNTASFTQGFSTLSGGGIENKTYINAAGDRRTIMLIGGVPMQQVPDGFVEDTPANRATFRTVVEDVAEETTDEAAALQAEIELEGGRTGEDFSGDRSVADFAGMSPSERSAEVARGSAFGGMLGGMMAGPVAAKGVRSMARNGMAEEMSKQGLSEKDIADAMGTSGEGKGKGGLGGIGDAISGMFGGIFGGKSASSAPAPSAPTAPSVSVAAPSPGVGVSAGGDDGDDGDDGGATGDAPGAGDPSGGYMAKGGLVTRKPTKTKPKTKRGLGSKR